jgi:hypothetical protein
MPPQFRDSDWGPGKNATDSATSTKNHVHSIEISREKIALAETDNAKLHDFIEAYNSGYSSRPTAASLSPAAFSYRCPR